MSKTLLSLLILVWILLIPHSTIFTQWSGDPNVNTQVCAAADSQMWPHVVTDGAGGVIIAWVDYRSGIYTDIYAQRLDSLGEANWAVNGIPICTAINPQVNITICSDDSGGAVLAWQDGRGGPGDFDIYAQRIDASGTVRWSTNGVAICTATNIQDYPFITSDGSSGAIIGWRDFRTGSNHIYAQRINASGIVQWTADGVAICTAQSWRNGPSVISDGSGGAILVWPDYRSGTNYDIYAQGINASGVVQWTADGRPVCTATNDQGTQGCKVITDGSGGAIITWSDYRSDPNNDLYVQRINYAGMRQWVVVGDSNGVPVCTAPGHQHFPDIASDGSGGAIITWPDNRNGVNTNIYAQRFNSLGDTLWIANGIPICVTPGNKSDPFITSDGSGGAVITWRDDRSGVGSDNYAQRVDALGNIQWESTGVPVSTAPNDQGYPMIASDGSGGAIITWHDYRSGAAHIYAQLVNSVGKLGRLFSSISGIVFNDLNDNGAKDSEEPGISNWKIYLSHVTVDSVLTDGGGNYTFDSLAAGVYTVSEEHIPDWTQTMPALPGTYSVTLAVGENATGKYFGNYQLPYEHFSHVKKGWNLLSIPMLVPDNRSSLLFPDAASPAYAYQDGYITKDSLVNGVGYWLKFLADEDIPVYGGQIFTYTFKVKQGWNMIGSISLPVSVNTIINEPSENINSKYFGYTSGVGYEVTDTILPGKGYWVKVKDNGTLILNTNVNFVCGINQVLYAGKTYNTVQIGVQCWLKENLDVGIMIDSLQNQTDNSSIEKYCYNNNPTNCNTYGGFYQWDEAMQYTTTEGARGICPDGWHIPTLAELQTLSTTIGGDGNALKAIGQGTGAGAGTNLSGFSALLSGYRWYDGYFYYLGDLTFFRSSTDYNINAHYLYLDSTSGGIHFSGSYKAIGFSIRCIKD